MRPSAGHSSPAPVDGARTLLALVTFGAFLSVAAGSILNVALPDIGREFGLPAADTVWFVLAFLVTVTVLLLLAGRLADVHGAGRAYVAGFFVFAAGSAGCALAGSAGALIGGRIAQGVGSAFTMATAPALLSLAMPAGKRGLALGLMSTATYVGLTVGPLAGGYLVEYLGWRSIFWLSGAVGLVVAAAGIFALRGRRLPTSKAASFDLAGAALIAVGTLSFLALVTEGPRRGLGHPVMLATAALWALSLPAFVLVERRHAAPVLDLELFRSRVFSTASVAAMLNYAALFVALFMLPFALRDGQKADPSTVGRVQAAQALAMALVAGVSGALSDRIGSRLLATAGMLALGAGMAGLAWMWPADAWTTALWLAVVGVGTGVFISPNSNAIMGSAPRNRQGIAGGVMGLSRNLGMTLGTAMASGLFASVGVGAKAAGSWSPAADAAVRTGLLVAAGVSVLAALIVWFGRPSHGRQAAAERSPR